MDIGLSTFGSINANLRMNFQMIMYGSLGRGMMFRSKLV